MHIRASRFVRKARCSKKLIKILALPIAWPACSTTLRQAMETRATFVGLLPAETRFSQSVTRSLWSKQLSRAFIEQTGCNQYFIRRKTIEITPFFLLSFPSFFFLSQTINEIALVLVVVVVVVVLPIQTCFIDYRTANWNTFSTLFEIFRYTNILATTPIITRRT